ncbi:Protein deglycase DJ-1zDJ-1 [Rhizophlyctis rosea]|uniref:D-lactate dehydratase n=1 Tax=Rhizophlyctis rosea TaxID=64517 RepID=A0AAD5X473_9FUNG|nr:Protein deglycase DJ-1zDJ-1 [Rhizophlyctis rosea]
MAPSALVLIADGSEEMEAVITIDILRRAEIEVTVAGLNGPQPVTCSRNVKLVPDKSLADVKGREFDALVLPGGLGGAKAFSDSAEVKALLKAYHDNAQKTVAIICASPIALKAANVGQGKRITSHPSVKDQLEGSYEYKEDRVVADGNLITSRGPGSALEFALEIVERLQGKETVQKIVPPMLVHPDIKV